MGKSENLLLLLRRLSLPALFFRSLDPTIVSVPSPGVKLTSLLFASETDCILVGDSEGHVSVYKPENLAVGAGTQVSLDKHVFFLHM